LCGDAAGALSEHFVIPRLFSGTQFSLGMGVKIGTIDVEDEAQ
jgi:hypothetical protein